MKKISKIAVAVVLIILSVFLLNSNTKNTSIEVSFENNSGETTTDFFLCFQNATNPQSVPNILANDTYITTMK